MHPRDLQTAAELCALVDTPDLLAWLGLTTPCTGSEALDALADRRKRLQAMQSNPKYRDSALFVIRHHNALARVLADPDTYLEHVRRTLETERLPMVELAVGAILADGVVTPREEAYVRLRARELGISETTYERVLREQADAAGVRLPDTGAPDGPQVDGGLRVEPTRRGPLRGATGHGWWDAAFTGLLLDAIPGGPGELVDLYCRTALSALTVLPERPQLSYLGVDRSEERLAQARKELSRNALYDVAARITLAPGAPHALPIPDESVDFVLAVRALANVPDTRAVFEEARRVLRPGGRLIAAEPDGFAESFVFDEHLVHYNAAFHRLLAAVDDARSDIPPLGRPGLAIGPQLSRRMTHAGFATRSVHVHAANNLRSRRLGRFASRLRGYPVALARAAGLPETSPALTAIHEAVDALEARLPPNTVGLSGHVLPLYVCVGTRP